MAEYDYTLHSRCVAALLQAGERSEQLERFFMRLAVAPFTRGGYQEFDSQGRTVEVIAYESWIVGFWVDHAVKQVHIVDIERID